MDLGPANSASRTGCRFGPQERGSRAMGAMHNDAAAAKDTSFIICNSVSLGGCGIARSCELAQLGLTSSCPSTRAESKSGTEILPHTHVPMTIGT
jgi:hypothetical protein